MTYQTMAKAYASLYSRLGLTAVMVQADSGAIGGKGSHEFMVLTPTGEDVVIHCDACGYGANVEKACSDKALAVDMSSADAELLPLTEVATPDSTTIAEVAGFIGVPQSKTAKAVFYVADGEFVFAVIRGDLEVNEVKLQRALKCAELRPAEEEEVAAAGIVAGYASPIGVPGVRVIVDDSVQAAKNLVAGANRVGYHYINSNLGRDYTANVVADIALVQEGDRCPECGTALRADRGIEVGHIFKLGTFLSDKLGANFLDETGRSKPAVMGCYGIGVGRLLAAIVEYSHDDKGIIWPMIVAPYQVHLCSLNPDKGDVGERSEALYEALVAEGIEVLYDDRPASPGVKFNDADLIGVPLRVTVSPRGLSAGNVELKWRAAENSEMVSVNEAAETIVKMVRDALAS